MWAVNFALTMAAAGAAANWLAAPAAGQATAYSVAASLYAASAAVETMSIIVFWLALVFLGIGMVLSTVYPRWMGWVGIVLGIATVAAVGIIEAFAGPSSTLELTFMVLSLLTTLWALVIGIWVARKAW
jgi:steroid 5-alpha reductase family enzyme